MTYRLDPQPGEWIDRDRVLGFRFEGRRFEGFAGDTLTSALLANGVRLLGRSFKYHRPRGVYSLANHDVNALMHDRVRTNIRADVTPLTDGADFAAVNTFGGLRTDRGRLIDRFGAFLPVGFYYKTFYTPRRLFPFYERRMRALAGLGAIDARRERVVTPKAYDFCDVLVVGAGPSGLSAAIAAAESGARVVLVDEHPRPGGSLNDQAPGDPEARPVAAALLAQAEALANLDVRPATVAAGAYADHWIALVDETRLVKMRARAVILATGVIEQPAIFGNNDLPGVMLATAARRLVHRFAVRPFRRGVVLSANAEGYRTALELHRAGVRVEAVIDLRPEGEPGEAGRAVRDAGIPVHDGHAVWRAIPDRDGLRGLEVCPLDAHGRVRPEGAFEVAGDGLAMSVGWAPADGLFYQAGGRMSWSDPLQQFVPRSAPPGLFAAGRLNGVGALADRLADGRRAGREAAAYLGLAPRESSEGAAPTAGCPNHPYPIFPHPRDKNFIDLDEDVHYKDILHAAQEGFDHVELLKRYATVGMGPTQGKLANLNAIRVLAQVRGQTVPETGVTTSRPFIHPVPLAHLAGRGFHPHRRTALHTRHEKAGAVPMPVGEWTRPAYYDGAGRSRAQAIAEEVRAVRHGAGLIDVGTLGKLEVSGPDAGAFLERLYTGRFAGMKVGTTRYGLLCDESGVVVDDGVIARLAEDRYYVTTTTTGSGAVFRGMQRWAILWGHRVELTNATGAFAAINLAGPQTRAILGPLCDLDLSEPAFPYLAVRDGRVAGARARLLRVGFVGELGYEIHLLAHHAAPVWDALLEAGRPHGLRPFGVEAQRVLRLEKGHPIIGQDTDGLTHPFEAGLDWAVKMNKPFFVGQRSLAILQKKPIKRRLVGFTMPAEQDPAGARMPQECHLVIEQGQILGRVTSVAQSPSLDRVIGMAFLPPDRSAPGTPFQVRLDDGALVTATVATMPFYDPENLRQTQASPPDPSRAPMPR